MENSKDIQKTDVLTHFLDSQVRTNPFGQNTSGERMYRRAERIVVALHLLTNHIPGEEPVRPQVRNAGLELLSHILALSEEMRAPHSAQFHATQVLIRKIISLIRMLPAAGHLSLQNASTVIEALDELGNFLTVSQRSALSETIIFSKDDLLGTENIAIPPVSRRVPHTQTPSVEPAVEGSPGDVIKDNKDIYRTDLPKEANVLDRRGVSILDIVKSQGTVGIKDIAANLPEYSEKMIQRELVHLSTLGRVKKVGFKRWSKYMFVQ